MLYLLIILLCLTGLFAYFGFLRRATEQYLLPRFRGAVFIFLMLSLASGYAVYREFTAAEDLSAFISPYEHIDESIYVPATPGNRNRLWLFKTPDPPQKVERFYADTGNLPGWELIHGFPFLTLRKNNLELVISTSRPDKTLISYELTEIPQQPDSR